MCRAKCGVVVGTSRPLPGYWITPVLRVLRTLCHPLQQSRFMSGGAKRSSLNQRFHEIKIDSFLDIWIDGWIYLSIQISFAISPKSLIWPGNKALLWAQEAKLLLLHTSLFLRAPSACASRAIGALLSSYFFIGGFGWTSPFFPNENGKGCITSRCRFVFRPK